MIAWWGGESASGSPVSDAIGTHDGGFFSGNSPANASYTPNGKVGSAFAFDSAVYVRIPDAGELRPSKLTAEAWVFPTSSSSELQAVIALGAATSRNVAWLMGLSNGVPQFVSQHLGSGALELAAPSPILLNAWTHLAISFDGT